MQPLSSGKRIAYIDITKAFAIFTVVLGHVLQWTTAGDPYHCSAPFIFIYSFHMPLFMLLSGYFIFAAIISIRQETFSTTFIASIGILHNVRSVL